MEATQTSTNNKANAHTHTHTLTHRYLTGRIESLTVSSTHRYRFGTHFFVPALLQCCPFPFHLVLFRFCSPYSCSFVMLLLLPPLPPPCLLSERLRAPNQPYNEYRLQGRVQDYEIRQLKMEINILERKQIDELTRWPGIQCKRNGTIDRSEER